MARLRSGRSEVVCTRSFSPTRAAERHRRQTSSVRAWVSEPSCQGASGPARGAGRPSRSISSWAAGSSPSRGSGPGGRWLAYVMTEADGSRLALVDLDAASPSPRAFVIDPAPRAGRGLGGGAFDWLPDGTGLVYIGSDGALWCVGIEGNRCPPVVAVAGRGRAGGDRASGGDRVPGRRCPGAGGVGRRNPGRVHGRPAPHRGDPAGRSGRPRVLDGGRRAGLQLRPRVQSRRRWSRSRAGRCPTWRGTERRGTRRRSTARGHSPHGGRASEHGRAAARVRARRGADRDHRRHRLAERVGGRSTARRSRRAVRSTPGRRGGRGSARGASRPTARRVAFCRNEAGFGRLCVADVATGAVIDVGRGVHGQLSWQGDRLAAIRSGARHPDRDRRVRRRWPRLAAAATGSHVGPDPAWVVGDPRRAGAGVDRPRPWPSHARRYRAPSPTGRLLVWVHGGPTSQWDVAFLPGVAFWTSRGWDVLLVDPRGSTGHGTVLPAGAAGRVGPARRRRHGGDGAPRPRRRMGEPDRTVVMGGSSGGLTVLGDARPPRRPRRRRAWRCTR